MIGDVTILEDVNVGVAAQVAANICGVKVGPVAVLGQAVDRSGATQTVCTTDKGPVALDALNVAKHRLKRTMRAPLNVDCQTTEPSIQDVGDRR